MFFFVIMRVGSRSNMSLVFQVFQSPKFWDASFPPQGSHHCWFHGWFWISLSSFLSERFEHSQGFGRFRFLRCSAFYEDTILFFLARTFWRLYSFRLFGFWYPDQTISIPSWTALGFSLKLKQLKQPWRTSILSLYLKQKLIDSLVSSLKQSHHIF